MSEDWSFYFCQMGGHTASIFFDDGIAGDLDRLALPNALRIRVPMRHARNGLPTNEEAERLFVVEDLVKAAVDQAGGIYLGRITFSGYRCFHALVPVKDRYLSSRLSEVGATTGYDLRSVVEPDPDKDVYWKELWPTEDDRRVMQDMKVLDALKNDGDEPTVERPVDHWISFADRHDAEAYGAWAAGNGYVNLQVEDLRDRADYRPIDRPVCVRCVHRGPVLLNAVTQHTLALSRKARDLNGRYDGWETPVMRAGAPLL